MKEDQPLGHHSANNSRLKTTMEPVSIHSLVLVFLVELRCSFVYPPVLVCWTVSAKSRTDCPPMFKVILMSGTMACLCLSFSILASTACGIRPENRLKTSNSQGTPGQVQRQLMTCHVSTSSDLQVGWWLGSCLHTHPPSLAPGQFLPPSQTCRLGIQRLAAASLNSLLVNVESAP